MLKLFVLFLFLFLFLFLIYLLVTCLFYKFHVVKFMISVNQEGNKFRDTIFFIKYFIITWDCKFSLKIKKKKQKKKKTWDCKLPF